jgi:hypothetical protein
MVGTKNTPSFVPRGHQGFDGSPVAVNVFLRDRGSPPWAFILSRGRNGGSGASGVHGSILLEQVDCYHGTANIAGQKCTYPATPPSWSCHRPSMP